MAPTLSASAVGYMTNCAVLAPLSFSSTSVTELSASTVYALSSPATAALPGRLRSAPPAVTRKLRITAASPAFSRASPSCASFTPSQRSIL